MVDRPVCILMLGDPQEAERLRAELAAAEDDVRLEPARDLDDALARVKAGGVDALIADQGVLETPEARARLAGRDAPVILMVEHGDEAAPMTALSMGAQDYLVKGEATGDTVLRSVRYSVERHQLRRVLRSMALTDELTGLDNRRGLLTKAEAQLPMLSRVQKDAAMLAVDVRGLKEVNEEYGRAEGDNALHAVTDILRETFRTSDILARVAGGRFLVFALVNPGEPSRVLTSRLAAALKKHNARPEAAYPLRLDMGAALYSEMDETAGAERMAEAATRELEAAKENRS